MYLRAARKNMLHVHKSYLWIWAPVPTGRETRFNGVGMFFFCVVLLASKFAVIAIGWERYNYANGLSRLEAAVLIGGFWRQWPEVKTVIFKPV